MPRKADTTATRVLAGGLVALAAVVALGLIVHRAAAAPAPLEATTDGLSATVEGALRGAAAREAPSTPVAGAVPHLTDVLPTVPASPGPVTPSSASGGEAAGSEGAGTSPTSMEDDTGDPVASPTAGTHLSPAVAEARTDSARGVGNPGGGPDERASGPVPAAAIFGIPDPAPASETPAQGTATLAGDGDGPSRPLALSDWIGSGPPLPPVFVYLAVFASGLAIVVSMRRELGLYSKRRRRF